MMIKVHTKIANSSGSSNKRMQALLHTCNIRSTLSKTRFVAHRVNLLAARPIKEYMVPSCGYLETALVNFAKEMLCFSKPWWPIIF